MTGSTKLNITQSHFRINLSVLRAGKPLPFHIHLYFEQNHHLLVFRKKGERLSADFLVRYNSRGVHHVWLHIRDRELFHKYLVATPDELEHPPFVDQRSSLESNSSTSNKKLNLLVDQLVKLVGHPSVDSRKITAILAKCSRTLLKESFLPTNGIEQKEANQAACRAVRKILDPQSSPVARFVKDTWDLLSQDEGTCHPLNVATYGVLLALAMGKNEPTLLFDLALAGLLHDIGVSQIESDTSTTAWKEQTPRLKQNYSNHVEESILCVNDFWHFDQPESSATIPKRVLDILSQHHEQINGKGFPKGLLNFSLEKSGQFLAISELIDSISNGQWNGTSHSYTQALDIALELGHFGPELMQALKRWTKAAA